MTTRTPPPSVEWLAVAAEGGETCFRVGRRGAELVAEWVGAARLVASRDGARHELSFEPGVLPELRRKLSRGPVRALLRHLRGELSLHGAAVAVGGRAIVIVGASGHGKSTFAAALCRRGGTLLADDTTALSIAEDGTVRVEPTEEEHWLDASARDALGLVEGAAEGADSKCPVSAKAADHVVPAGAVLSLSWASSEGDEPRIRTLQGIAALELLLPNVVRFAVDSAEHQARELSQLDVLLRQVPVHLLERPRGFERLGPTIDMALKVCLNTP